MIISDSYKISQ